MSTSSRAKVVSSFTLIKGTMIPETYAVATPTADGTAEMAGRDLSPGLQWSGEPEGTRSFAISVVDPDVPADRNRMGVEGLSLGDDEPRVEFAHWLVVDIPTRVHELPGRSPGRTATEGCSRATRTSRAPTADGTARSHRGTTNTCTTT